MSRDPLDGDVTDPATLHKYNYAGADPINLTDPTGRQAREGIAGGSAGEWIGLAGAAIAVAAGYDATHPGAVRALGQEIACDLTLEGSDVSALVKWAIDTGSGESASIERQDKCHVEEKAKNKTRHEKHPNWPVNYVHLAITPQIGAHISLAIAEGKTDALTYLGRNNPLQKINRGIACPDDRVRSPGKECDEYPYASTAQGGAGASTTDVDAREQRIQGGQLGAFYGNLNAGDNFCVEVVP